MVFVFIKSLSLDYTEPWVVLLSWPWRRVLNYAVCCLFSPGVNKAQRLLPYIVENISSRCDDGRLCAAEQPTRRKTHELNHDRKEMLIYYCLNKHDFHSMALNSCWPWAWRFWEKLALVSTAVTSHFEIGHGASLFGENPSPHAFHTHPSLCCCSQAWVCQESTRQIDSRFGGDPLLWLSSASELGG